MPPVRVKKSFDCFVSRADDGQNKKTGGRTEVRPLEGESRAHCEHWVSLPSHGGWPAKVPYRPILPHWLVSLPTQ
jgi:hypothetical protein